MEPIYHFEEEFMFLLPGLAAGIPSWLFGIAGYVLTALAIYTISRRRGLKNPWLAWVPVVNCWLLGSLSDQYRYVVLGQNRSKRKVLLILSLVMAALWVAVLVLGLVTAGTVIFSSYRSGTEFLPDVLGPVFGLIGLALPLAGVAIAYAVVRYMALYDVFKSLDPGNCVLFLVLSICFGFTEPFFLFFSRNKDAGMPPRRGAPEAATSEPVEPFWEVEDKDYL